MSVLSDDQMNSVINCLTAKSTWDDLILYHEDPSDVKESSVIDLKLCYNTFKFKEGETLTQTFIRYKALMNELDTRSSHEYLNDLKEEYQARALLAKSKRFFKKVTQSSSQQKPELRPTKDFEAKYNKVKAKLALLSSSASALKAANVKNKGLIAEAYEWNKEEMSSDDNEMVEVKVLMALVEENDAISKEDARNGEHVKISIKKRIPGVDQLTEDPSNSGQKDLVFVKSLAVDTKVSIPGVERPWLCEAEGFILPNYDTGRILSAKSHRNTTDPSVTVTDSSATDYDSADESSVCSTPLHPLKKLDGAEPILGQKTIKLILRSKSTFKAETLKGIIINEPSSTPAKGNKISSALKVISTSAGKLKSVKIEDDPLLAIIIKELNNLKLQISKNQSSYSINNQQVPQNALQNKYKTQFKKSCDLTRDHAEYISTNEYVSASQKSGLCGSYDHDTNGHNMIISLEREINPRNPQHTFKICEACGSSTHTTTDHYDIEWFKREVDKDANLEFSAIVSSELFDFDVILIFNSFDEGYNSFRSINHEKYTLVIVDEYSRAEDTSIPISSVVTPTPQDRWSQDKPIELVNIIGNPGAGMLTRAMAKELGAALAHECIFVDFLSEKEHKKVSEALKHPRWVDAMQD
nr:retrovirus-related Pol polyprotein from transposon TNT 1-94 [Tanacetum cinerariifolium]